MIKTLLLILALIAEVLLLIIIFFFFLLGFLGFFLPIVPGFILVGAGVAIYSLMIKNNFGKITPKLNRHVINTRDVLMSLPLTQKIMGIFNKIQKKRAAKVQEEILKYGMILLGFNLILSLGFVFTVTALSFLIGLTRSTAATLAFVPLITIFIFAALSAVIWYRFGQILGPKFKKRKVLNASLVVLISILPLLLLLFLLSSMLSLVGGFKQEMLALTFLSIIMMSILSSVFELAIVSIGAATTATK